MTLALALLLLWHPAHAGRQAERPAALLLAATVSGLRPGLLAALCGAESGWRDGAVSVEGAEGACQIRWAGGAGTVLGRYGYRRSWLRRTSLALVGAGVVLRYLRGFVAGGDEALLAAWNCGPTRAGRAECVAFARRVLGDERDVARRMAAALGEAAGVAVATADGGRP